MSTVWVVAFAALSAVVVVLTLAVLGTLRRVSVVLEQAETALRGRKSAGPEGVPVGAEIPEFEGTYLDGSPFTRSSVFGAASVLLFLGRSCPACRALEEDLRTADVPVYGVQLFAVVSDFGYADTLAAFAGLEVVIQEERAIADAFGSHVTPHAFAIDVDGIVRASGTPNSIDSLGRLIDNLGGDVTSEARAKSPA
ncbi:MAG: redoxin domain-containing protein [Actinomycetota bacterium]|nr:redoxin domain-containing protein [Actinomycetota bacterium]